MDGSDQVADEKYRKLHIAKDLVNCATCALSFDCRSMKGSSVAPLVGRIPTKAPPKSASGISELGTGNKSVVPSRGTPIKIEHKWKLSTRWRNTITCVYGAAVSTTSPRYRRIPLCVPARPYDLPLERGRIVTVSKNRATRRSETNWGTVENGKKYAHKVQLIPANADELIRTSASTPDVAGILGPGPKQLEYMPKYSSFFSRPKGRKNKLDFHPEHLSWKRQKSELVNCKSFSNAERMHAKIGLLYKYKIVKHRFLLHRYKINSYLKIPPWIHPRKLQCSTILSPWRKVSYTVT